MFSTTSPLKISPPPPPPRKIKTVTFRIENEIYDVLAETARLNGMTLSSLMAFSVEDYLHIQGVTHKKSQYLNTLRDEEREEALDYEKKYPPEFRHFALAQKAYPKAKKLGDEEMRRLNDF